MSELLEAVRIFANVLASVIVEVYNSGGNAGLLVLSIIGIFSILSSVMRDASKTLGALFVVCIATPFLFIEYLIKKYKNRNE